MKCENCGERITDKNAIFCPECGKSLKIHSKSRGSEKTEIDLKKSEWPNIAIYLGIWGFVNLAAETPTAGIILIVIAILVKLFNSFKAIYTFGAACILIAFVQLILLFINSTHAENVYQLSKLILLPILNFVIGGYVIYETRKVEKTN